ncbi:hypothetical protein LBMAG21_08720 [Armatimonadota bacterium]|nr:hypothetical protein LBMAG21_08720 [Armatimonadota bacterium]
MQQPRQYFEEIFHPRYYTRIGLRYQDMIVRSRIGLDGIAWNALLQPYILGELGSNDIESSIVARFTQCLINLSASQSQVRLGHGFGPDTEEGVPYVIDSDFFTDIKTEKGQVLDALDYFNKQSGRLFRWCITPRLHAAMDPQQA